MLCIKYFNTSQSNICIRDTREIVPYKYAALLLLAYVYRWGEAYIFLWPPYKHVDGRSLAVSRPYFKALPMECLTYVNINHANKIYITTF